MAISYAEFAGPPGFPGAMSQTTKSGTTTFGKAQGVVPQKRRVDLTGELEQLEFLAMNPRAVHPRVLASRAWELRRKLIGSGDWQQASYGDPRQRYDTRADLARRLDLVERALGIGGASQRMMAGGGLGSWNTPEWGQKHHPVERLAACIRVALCRPRAFCCPGGLEPVRSTEARSATAAGRGGAAQTGSAWAGDPRLPLGDPRLPLGDPRLPPPFGPTSYLPLWEPEGTRTALNTPNVNWSPVAPLMPGNGNGLVEAPGSMAPRQQVMVTSPGPGPALPPPSVITGQPQAPVVYQSFPSGPPASSAAAQQPAWLESPGQPVSAIMQGGSSVPGAAPLQRIPDAGVNVTNAQQMYEALPQAQPTPVVWQTIPDAGVNQNVTSVQREVRRPAPAVVASRPSRPAASYVARGEVTQLAPDQGVPGSTAVPGSWEWHNERTDYEAIKRAAQARSSQPGPAAAASAAASGAAQIISGLGSWFGLGGNTPGLDACLSELRGAKADLRNCRARRRGR